MGVEIVRVDCMEFADCANRLRRAPWAALVEVVGGDTLGV
eukprot:COSAG02_NODE_5900_length_3950_cov_51.280966_2_plen_40_part_00